MEVARLVLDYMTALVWPVLVLLAVLLFRGQLAEMLGRLTSLKLPGGASADFQRRVEGAEAASGQIIRAADPALLDWEHGASMRPLAEKEASLGMVGTPNEAGFGAFLAVSNEDPNVALAGLRMEMERMLKNVASRGSDGFKSSQRSAREAAAELRSEGILPNTQYQLLSSILGTANAAMHGESVSKEDAARVIDAAEAFRMFYYSWLQTQ